MLFYRAALPLSRQTLTLTAGLIRRHRALTGSLWRKLNAGQSQLWRSAPIEVRTVATTHQASEALAAKGCVFEMTCE